MASAKALLDEKREEILKLAALHGAANVRVFGSVARGDDRDIDLLVHMEDGRSMFDLVRFATGVEGLVGRKVDVVSDGGSSPYMRDCCIQIREYTVIGRAAFLASRLHQDAGIRNFQIIGEASKKLSVEAHVKALLES